MAIGVWHGQVCLCDWIESRRFPAHLAASRNAFLGIDVTNEADMELVSSVAGWIGRYLDGERERMPFDIAPVGTPFQKSVWDVIAGIPYGGTLSYSALASAIGRPDAVRAVASACASNPVSLLVPATGWWARMAPSQDTPAAWMPKPPSWPWRACRRIDSVDAPLRCQEAGKEGRDESRARLFHLR